MNTRDVVLATLGVLAGCVIGAAATQRASAQSQLPPLDRAGAWCERIDRLDDVDRAVRLRTRADWDIATVTGYPGQVTLVCYRRTAR